MTEFCHHYPGVLMSTPVKMELYTKLRDAYALEIDFENVLKHERLWQMISNVSDSTCCYPHMFFLPMATAVCGLMGQATIRTSRNGSNIEEPNIIWSCVAAEPGARKSPALKAILSSLQTVESEISPSDLLVSQQSGLSDGPDSSFSEGSRKLYVANEGITMCKLHAMMYSNGGVHLTLSDEVDGLFKTLETVGRSDSKDRAQWLSLHGGMPWTKTTSNKGQRTIANTRLNYAGYLQPQLLIERLTKGDVDGMMDRHIVGISRRRIMFYQNNAKEMDEDGEDLTLTKLFREVHHQHDGKDARYVLNKEANEAFGNFYDSLERQIQKFEEDGFRGFLQKQGVIGTINKSGGFALRMALIAQATYNAADQKFTTEVGLPAMFAAIEITKYYNKIKMILQGKNNEEKDTEADPTEVDTSPFPEEEEEFLKLHRESILKVLSYEPEQKVTSTKVQQDKKVPKGKAAPYYTEKRTKAFLTRMSQCGLGIVESGKRKSLVFRVPADRKGGLSSPVKKFLEDNALYNRDDWNMYIVHIEKL